jgi:hypothetical protein
MLNAARAVAWVHRAQWDNEGAKGPTSPTVMVEIVLDFLAGTLLEGDAPVIRRCSRPSRYRWSGSRLPSTGGSGFCCDGHWPSSRSRSSRREHQTSSRTPSTSW